ncbi:MAG TPA: YdeI/OmpD-associated family protein [Verrucomicrobiae bacterium]|nr:YdeI/OmpD-associated family protein [Verrucomicrobiae bacterium]
MTRQSYPADVAAALKKSGLMSCFDALSPSHQREYLKWIAEAKRPETRQARIEKTLQMLSQKRGDPA